MLFKTNHINISYEPHLDGGGTTFGINALNSENVNKYIKKGKILEMCSGPGFMGFNLLSKGYCEELFLVDINEEVTEHINNTKKINDIDNVMFIKSNVFDNLKNGMYFDTIISNPPHFKTERLGGYRFENEKLLSLDDNMNFHKKFFSDAKKHLVKNGVIILVENCDGVTEEDIRELSKNHFKVQYVEYNKYGWEGKSNFYTIILSNEYNTNIGVC